MKLSKGQKVYIVEPQHPWTVVECVVDMPFENGALVSRPMDGDRILHTYPSERIFMNEEDAKFHAMGFKNRKIEELENMDIFYAEVLR